MLDRKIILITNVFSDPLYNIDVAESHCLNREEFFFVLDIRDRFELYKEGTFISIREKRKLEEMCKRLWKG
jgi:hypothetical protein